LFADSELFVENSRLLKELSIPLHFFFKERFIASPPDISLSREGRRVVEV